MAPPKKYPDELREQAVLAYRASAGGTSIRRLAIELGVHQEALRSWVRRDEAERAADSARADDGDGPATPDGDGSEPADVVRRLRDENDVLRRDNSVLLAATALFARELDRVHRRYP